MHLYIPPSFHLITNFPIIPSLNCLKKPYNTPMNIFRLQCTSSLITIGVSWLEARDSLNLSLLLSSHISAKPSPSSSISRTPIIFASFKFFPLPMLPQASLPYLHLIAYNGGRKRGKIGAIQQFNLGWVADLLHSPKANFMSPDGLGERCYGVLKASGSTIESGCLSVVWFRRWHTFDTLSTNYCHHILVCFCPCTSCKDKYCFYWGNICLL